MTRDPRWEAAVASHPHPLLFATVSGAHLYGFPSPDSDADLRGVHVLPLPDLLRIAPPKETVDRTWILDGLEVDLVTHEARKFFGLLLQRNGYVLEQLCSPLVVRTSPAHQELLSLVPRLVTRHHAHHYRGFAHTQWNLFAKESPPRVKPLLYVYRVLLTGIHLLRTGTVEANLVLLNEEYRLPYVPDLVARKVGGHEKAVLQGAEVDFHAAEFERLLARLGEEETRSALPEAPTARPALDDLLVRIRLG